jgi:hypothetical protein
MALLLNKVALPNLCFRLGAVKLIKKKKKKLPSHLLERKGLEQGCRGTVVSVIVPVSSRCSVVIVVPVFIVVPLPITAWAVLCVPVASSTPLSTLQTFACSVVAGAESSWLPQAILVVIFAGAVLRSWSLSSSACIHQWPLALAIYPASSGSQW